MKIIILFFLLIFSTIVQCIEEPDTTIIINEKLINKFMGTLGEVKGKSSWNVAGVKGDYEWKVENSKIELNPDFSFFYADATVNTWILNYKTPVKGKVQVRYLSELDKIILNIVEAKIGIYVDILFNKVHVTDVDISNIYPIEYNLNTNKLMDSSIPITMPDGKIKKIDVKLKDRNMRIEKSKIIIDANFDFKEK